MEQPKNDNVFEISPDKIIFKVGLLIMEIDAYKEQLSARNNEIAELKNQLKNGLKKVTDEK